MDNLSMRQRAPGERFVIEGHLLNVIIFRGNVLGRDDKALFSRLEFSSLPDRRADFIPIAARHGIQAQ